METKNRNDGYLEYQFRKDGIYGVYHPPQEGGQPMSLEDLQMELLEKGMMTIDRDQILKLYREKGTPVKLANALPETSLADAQFEISVDSSETWATLSYTPAFGGKEPSKHDILAKLSEEGVVYGIKQEKIEEILRERKTIKDELIAEGTPLQDGESAQIEYLVDFGQRNLSPKELEDGKVDYREVATVFYVEKGQPLARKIPAKPGQDGKTITGRTIRARVGKDITLRIGKGAKIDETDPCLVSAAEEGCPALAGKKICVLPLYKVDKDVDFSTGNIYFLGNIVVHGNIKPGFKVVATGNIEIHGRVEEGNLEAEGDILVRGGIIGRGKSIIKAGGGVRSRFIEQAYIEAVREIKVGEEIFHSEIMSGERVVMEGKHGQITGGKIMATHTISARNFGNRLATETILCVGLNPKVMIEKKKLKENIEKTGEALKQVDATIIGYQKKTRALPSQETEEGKLLLRLAHTKRQLQARLKSYIEKQQLLAEEIERDEKARIICTGTCFSGVQIDIIESIYKVKEEMRRPIFYLTEEGVSVTTATQTSKKKKKEKN